MSYVWQRWLIPELRAAAAAAGLPPILVVEGAETRGRPASTGNFNPLGPHTKHHTGTTTSPANPRPTLRTLIVGRPDLPGPLVQVSTCPDGVIVVVACGRANHAGLIGKSGVIGMPLGADGNALAIGDEVETNGTQTLPPIQIKAMDVVSAVVLEHTGRPAEWVHRHADISGTGKWDLGSRTTAACRAGAAAALNNLEDPMAQFTEQELVAIAEKGAGKALEKFKHVSQVRAQNVAARLRELAGDNAQLRGQLDDLANQLEAALDEQATTS